MPSGGVRVTGLRENVKALQEIGVTVADLKAAFSAIAAKAAEVASNAAPAVSGALRGSIRGNKAKNNAVVTAGRAAVPYAGAQNYGWASRNIAPHGFMQKADEAVAPYAEQQINAEIDRIIREQGLK